MSTHYWFFWRGIGEAVVVAPGVDDYIPLQLPEVCEKVSALPEDCTPLIAMEDAGEQIADLASPDCSPHESLPRSTCQPLTSIPPR